MQWGLSQRLEDLKFEDDIYLLDQNFKDRPTADKLNELVIKATKFGFEK